MKKIFLLVIVLVSFLSVKAELVDSEGMPIVYLKGTLGHNHWQADEDYRFTRTGNTYSLEITAQNPVPEGQFKIADEDWAFDFGGSENDIYVDSSVSLPLSRSGANLHTKGFQDATISFEYEGYDNLTVNFDIRDGSQDATLNISGTLPVLYINVYTDESHSRLNDEVTDYNLPHKDYFTEAEYWLDVDNCEWMKAQGAESIGSEQEPLPLQIKARGNWTRIGFSKKPFKIKLDKKQNMLGLTPEKSKHYALLAHADDNFGYLRNFTTFKLGEKIGLPWTPAIQPVELVINGDYRGLYFLTESVRVGDGRILIQEQDDNVSDPALVSGGYVVELDNYYEENQIRMEEKSCATSWQNLDELRITYDTPEAYSELQKRFVTDQFSAINDAIGRNSDVTWSYLDLDDAVRYYLVQEIVSHVEAFHGSTYLYRDNGENQKWHFSPLWDAGNAFNGFTDDFLYNCDPFGNTWIPSLRENDMFNQKLKETWLWFMANNYSEIFSDIEEYASHIQAGAIADHRRWKNEPHPGGGQPVADNTDMKGKLQQVESHLEAKVKWLKTQFGNYESGNYAEPERDTTPAAPLPDYALAGIEEITESDTLAPKEFYTLQGVKVANPQPGQIYILRQGSKSRKVIIPAF